jgi:hypothetical protein
MTSTWQGYLVKTDASGQPEWEATDNDFTITSYRDVVETSEGGFMVGGYARGTESEFYGRLLRYDADGNLDVFHPPMPSYAAVWDQRRLYGLQRTPDNGYMVTGWIENLEWAYGLWVAKTDSNLNIQWEKTYAVGDAAGAWGLSITNDGGSILAGFDGDYNWVGEDIWLVKTDENGDTLWSTKFVTADNDRCNGVKQTLDGGYILAGTKGMDDYLQDGNGWLIKTDASGTLEWDFSFDAQDSAFYFYDVEQISETDYIIVGSIYPSGGYAEAFVARISTAEEQVVCGDANGDGDVNVGDAVFLIAYVFNGGPAPDPICSGDANGDGNTNIGDAVYLIAYVFKGGPPPVEGCCL